MKLKKAIVNRKINHKVNELNKELADYKNTIDETNIEATIVACNMATRLYALISYVYKHAGEVTGATFANVVILNENFKSEKIGL